MAWRMVLRRVPTRSLTIVGDVAQTSARGGVHHWATSLEPVLRGSWRLAELTVNYRTPAQVADAAGVVATAAGLPVGTLTSAREVPGSLRVRLVDDLATSLVAEAADVLAGLSGDEGSGRVAVIAAPGRVAGLDALLRAAGLGAQMAEAGARAPLDARLAVLSPRDTKGLEFDVVVLVEPGELSPPDLYVAMTRPTRSLRVLGTDRLPDGLDLT